MIGRRRRAPGDYRLLVTVTLNDTQLRGYLRPILELPEVASVTLVADVPAPPLPKLRTVVPPRLLVRTLGRAGAKLVMSVALARRDRPDWVVGYNLVPHGITATLAGALSGARVLYVMIGGPIEWAGGGWESDNNVVGRLPRPVPLLERVLFAFVRRATAIVTMGSAARDELIRRGIQPDRVRVIPASVDDRFRLSLNGSRPYDIVTTSALIPRKRVEDIIEAVASLRATRPDLRAAVLGDGPLADELRAHAARLGVAGAIDFLGFRNDVETIYSQASVFVLASRYEGLSNALTDAMATGLPAVVSDVGEARDLVKPERNGFLYRCGDVDDLAHHLALILDDPERRRAMGEAAAADAQALAGRDRVAGAYAAIFREL